MLPAKILVATDGSPTAAAAVDFAAELARATKVTAVTVLSVVPLKQRLEVKATPEHRAHHEKIAEEAAARVREIIGDDPIRVEELVLEASSVADSIIKHAHDGKACDHIVLGDRGHGEFASVFLGSVAHHVVQGAHCPVTIVRL